MLRDALGMRYDTQYAFPASAGFQQSNEGAESWAAFLVTWQIYTN